MMFSTSAPRWITSRGTAILGSLVLLTPLALADSACMDTRTAAQPQIAEKLNLFEQTALTTRTQLDRYAATVRTGLPHRTTHSSNLTHARENVNRLGRQMAEMEKLNSEATPMQQAAIREARPHLEQLASQMTIAINRMNEGTSVYRTQDFREMVNNMYKQSDQLYTKVDALRDFEHACDRAIQVTSAGNSEI